MVAMKSRLGLVFLVLLISVRINAQRYCVTKPGNSFVTGEQVLRNPPAGIIKIPIVVHVLFHEPGQNIPDAKIQSQIDALNRDFRKMNPDSVNTPPYFKQFAADCEIEFVLAKSDPFKRATTGITRTYTPIKQWSADDKMKLKSEMGVDGWDSRYYLNIWVCELDQVAGYASWPGENPAFDGIVVDFASFGTVGVSGPYNMGRTVVHEAGHWLNLKHTWGEEHCGDDGVDDTPQQSVYTVGCPSGIRISCDNGPNGNMYMNYMDFTEDACMNLFTYGQKNRMRNLFAQGGARYNMLYSKGLDEPLIFELPLPAESPKWLYPKVFPVPAVNYFQLDVSYDVRWIGKILTLYNLQGQQVLHLKISAAVQQYNISRLQPGIYFLRGNKEDGELINFKILKQ